MSATPGPGGRYTDDHDRFGTKRGVVRADHDPTLPARATGGLRIVSTGPRSTSIELDGVEISDHVTAIRLDMATDGPTTATLTMRADSVYIVAGEAVIERNDEAPDADDGALGNRGPGHRVAAVSVQPESVHTWVADERRDAQHAGWATAPDTRPDPWELDHE